MHAKIGDGDSKNHVQRFCCARRFMRILFRPRAVSGGKKLEGENRQEYTILYDFVSQSYTIFADFGILTHNLACHRLGFYCCIFAGSLRHMEML